MSEPSSLFVEFHVLRSHAPSNLNRDDLGSPKTAVFGGVRRLRISSQCLKRTWRTSSFFRGELGEELLGIRTRLLPKLVIDRLTAQGASPEVADGLAQVLQAIGKSDRSNRSTETTEDNDDDDDGVTEPGHGDATGAERTTAHLLFLSAQEVDQVGVFAAEQSSELAKVFKVGKRKREVDSAQREKLTRKLAEHLAAHCKRNAVDVSLFGRFVTSDEIKSVDAALQVAHALGTQKVDLEYDYFTAVDDVAETTGAGHVGEAEFASSVFYEYAVCDLRTLRRNLDGDRALASRAVRAILLAMTRAVPKGKKNSTAAENPADYVEVVVRSDAPVSLANAFLKPVQPTAKLDVLEESVARLRRHARKYDEAYGAEGLTRACLYTGDSPVEEVPRVASCRALAEVVEAEIARREGAW